MSSKTFVSVQVRIDWRLNSVSNKHTFAFTYHLRDDYLCVEAIEKHIGNLFDKLALLGVPLSSIEVSNARVDRI